MAEKGRQIMMKLWLLLFIESLWINLIIADWRQPVNHQFYVIANSSFQCEVLSSETTDNMDISPKLLPFIKEPSVKPYQLTSEDVLSLMEQHKITHSNYRVATTLKDVELFANLLPISESYTRRLQNAIRSRESNNLLKSEVIQFMQLLNEMEDTEDRSFHDYLIKPQNDDIEYCIQRGSKTNDGTHLRMCTTCAITTDQGQDFQPRYLNEVVCDNSDNGCLFTEGISHGRCQPIMLYPNVLQRQNDSCVLALKNGQTIVAEEWEVVPSTQRVGCQCEIDVNSPFSRLV